MDDRAVDGPAEDVLQAQRQGPDGGGACGQPTAKRWSVNWKSLGDVSVNTMGISYYYIVFYKKKRSMKCRRRQFQVREAGGAVIEFFPGEEKHCHAFKYQPFNITWDISKPLFRSLPHGGMEGGRRNSDWTTKRGLDRDRSDIIIIMESESVTPP